MFPLGWSKNELSLGIFWVERKVVQGHHQYTGYVENVDGLHRRLTERSPYYIKMYYETTKLAQKDCLSQWSAEYAQSVQKLWDAHLQRRDNGSTQHAKIEKKRVTKRVTWKT